MSLPLAKMLPPGTLFRLAAALVVSTAIAYGEPTPEPTAGPATDAINLFAQAAPEIDPALLAAADAAIQAPMALDALEPLLAAIEAHPYHQEVLKRLAPYGDHPQGYTAAKYRDPRGQYLAERAKLHAALVEKLLKPRAKAAAHQKPLALLVVGLPGSGKTTAAADWPRQLGVEVTTINADDVQALLPEYAGWNADLMHTEARDLVDSELLPRAIADRHNLLLDITGRDPERTTKMADDLSAAGYRLHLLEVELALPKSVYRVWQRFRRGAFVVPPSDADAGRFIAPRLVATRFAGRPEVTYRALKAHPAVERWRQVTTDVPAGEPLRVIEEGTGPAAMR